MNDFEITFNQFTQINKKETYAQNITIDIFQFKCGPNSNSMFVNLWKYTLQSVFTFSTRVSIIKTKISYYHHWITHVQSSFFRIQSLQYWHLEVLR